MAAICERIYLTYQDIFGFTMSQCDHVRDVIYQQFLAVSLRLDNTYTCAGHVWPGFRAPDARLHIAVVAIVKIDKMWVNCNFLFVQRWSLQFVVSRSFGTAPCVAVVTSLTLASRKSVQSLIPLQRKQNQLPS